MSERDIPEWCVEGTECDFYVPSLGMSDHVRIIYVQSPYSARCKSLIDGKVRSYGIIDLTTVKRKEK